MSDDPDWEKARDGRYYAAWYRPGEYRPRFPGSSPPNDALEQAADATGKWDQELTELDASIGGFTSKKGYNPPNKCALCGYEYEPFGRWNVTWDGEQWICGRCEKNTEAQPEKRCTCGQAKSGAGGFHSDWCDLVTGG